MRLRVTFLFVSLVVLSLAAAQSEARSKVGQNAASTQDQAITNGPVAEYVADSNCTIGWSTRVAGTMTLRYGTDRTKMTQTAEAVESKDGRNYHVRLNGLTPNTRYYFQVISAGEPISGVGTFQTVGQSETPIRSRAVIPQ
jgi:phosphodiesterase/alkaline phosphatase D-like protein